MIDGLQQKNISLGKGIVRTPSLGEDGELSECVNLIPQNGEMVRIHEPHPITEDITGKYVFYTLAWEKKGAGSTLTFAKSQPILADLPFEVHYQSSPGSAEASKKVVLPSGDGKISVDFSDLARQEDISSIDVGDEASAKGLEAENYELRAYKVFEWTSAADIRLPDEDTQVIAPLELQPGEILLETNRCAGKENLIVRNGNTLVFYRPGEGRHLIAKLECNDILIATLGQTLVISEGPRKRYFVWVNKNYEEQDILNCIPSVEINMGEPILNLLNHHALMNKDGKGDPESYLSNSIGGGFKATYYNTTQEGHLSGESYRANHTYLKDMTEDKLNKILGQYAQIRASWKDQGYVCFPFYVRVGVELYDGSVVNLTPPILVTPSSFVRPYFALYMPLTDYNLVGTTLSTNVTITPLLNPRAFFVHIDALSLKGIKEELVKGIVIYATPEIEPMDAAFKLSSVVVSKVQDEIEFVPTEAIVDGQGMIINQFRTVAGNGSWNEAFTHKVTGLYNFIWLPPAKEDISTDAQKFIDPSEFYLLARISYAQLKEADFRLTATPGNGTYIENYPPPHTSDGTYQPMKRTYRDEEYMILSRQGKKMLLLDAKSFSALASRESLAKVVLGQSSSDIRSPKTTYEYNARLIFGGFVEKEYIPNLPNQYIADCRTRKEREASQERWLMAVKMGDTYKSVTSREDYYPGFSANIAYVAVPGKQARAVVLGIEGKTYSLPLAKALNATGDVLSWCLVTPEWLRTRNNLAELYPKETKIEDSWLADNYDSSVIGASPNKVAVTKVTNPWVIDSVIDLSCGEIYAITSATEALSEGQYGAFPLYAFTSQGIFALEIGDNGAVRAVQPISRDVVYSAVTPLQGDRAVIYSTREGLKLLSGRTIKLLSEKISGPNTNETYFAPPDSLLIKDVLPFEQQISSAVSLYDPPLGSVHIFNPSEIAAQKTYTPAWANVDRVNHRKEEIESNIIMRNKALPYGLALNYRNPSEDGINTHEYIIADLSNSTPADVYMGIIVPIKKGEAFMVRQGLTPTSLHTKIFLSFDHFRVGDAYNPEVGQIDVHKEYTYPRDCYIAFSSTDTPAEWLVKTKGTTDKEIVYHTQSLFPVTEEQYKQKHYVYDLESEQWSTQILDKQLTTCVAGYPFSTMQFGRQLMQYTNDLEEDIVKPGWLLTRPISFNDPFKCKMLADIRLMGQKTHPDTKFRVQVYVSEDRQTWHRLTSLKGRSAKWYRFLIKADMCGLDTLTGIACQYVPRLGNKLR